MHAFFHFYALLLILCHFSVFALILNSLSSLIQIWDSSSEAFLHLIFCAGQSKTFSPLAAGANIITAPHDWNAYRRNMGHLNGWRCRVSFNTAILHRKKCTSSPHLCGLHLAFIFIRGSGEMDPVDYYLLIDSVRWLSIDSPDDIESCLITLPQDQLMVFVFVSHRGGPHKEKIDVCDATHNMLPGKIMKKQEVGGKIWHSKTQKPKTSKMR